MKFENDSKQVFVIAEAGSNWKCGTYEEDLNQAKKLIKIATNVGADAVKFQTYKSETVYVKNAGISDYLSKNGITENINEIFDNLSMPYEMIRELAKYCKEENIIFMSTPFSIQDAKEVDPFVSIHKVASFEINHTRLLEFLAKTGKPILISTGASTLDEIDFAYNFVKKHGNENVVFLQCTSQYPASIEAMNLAVIPKLKSKYNIPIGLSDHSIDPTIAPLVSIGLGATIIEKHFTIDRNLPGPDHAFALNPDELKIMIENIREGEKSLGSGIKIILNEEEELRNYSTRAIQSIKDIEEGEILREGENYEVLRSGNRIRGAEPRFLENIEGKPSLKPVKTGDGILDY